jgi:hypothetical protein
MAIAVFKHTPIGKKTQAEPYTAAAHARYAMRKSAAMKVFSENMPLNWHAVQRFLKEHEDGLRKNGRVADKFIIAIPREFTPEAAEKVLRSYGRRIGEGKAPFLVSFHWEENNPHAHMIFIDRDLETGRRVFGTSEMGSTELLKFNWAEEVNAQFKEMGLETRIEFGTRTEELAQAMNDNVSEPSPTPTTVVEEPPSLEELDNDLGRVDYEEELEAALEAELPVIEQEGASKYQQAFSAAQELRRIRHLQNELQAVRERYEGAEKANRQATERAQAAVALLAQRQLDAQQTREAYIQEHRGLFGKKGFQLSAFGFNYTSPARKAADQAEQDYMTAQTQALLAEKTVADERANLSLAQKDYDFYYKQFQSVQGNEQDLADAELLYENTFNAYAGDLTPEAVKELVEENQLQPQEAALILKTLGYPEAGEELEV